MKEFVSAASHYIHIALWLEFRRERLMNLIAPFRGQAKSNNSQCCWRKGEETAEVG